MKKCVGGGIQKFIMVLGLSVLLFLSGGLWAGGLSDAYKAHFVWTNARFLSWHTGSDYHYLQAQCYQESLFDPYAVSPVGAKGLCQFMPGTWKEVMGKLGYAHASPFSPKASILAAGAYMDKLLRGWTAERSREERLRFAWASYNCGFGCALTAQRRSGGSTLFWDVEPFLPRETRKYVEMIEKYHSRFTKEAAE